MQKNENPVVLSLVLLIISVAVALLLAFTNSITKDKIAENTQKEQNAAKQEVLPEAIEFVEVENTKDGIVNAVYEGKDDNGTVVGYCVAVAPSGYGGPIDLMVGVTLDNTISGVRVISHAETAGLGAKAQTPEFYLKYDGKSTERELSVIKNGEATEHEVVAISGATVTSKAVTNGVNAAVAAVKKLNGGV